jgi:hypothetical protein
MGFRNNPGRAGVGLEEITIIAARAGVQCNTKAGGKVYHFVQICDNFLFYLRGDSVFISFSDNVNSRAEKILLPDLLPFLV